MTKICGMQDVPQDWDCRHPMCLELESRSAWDEVEGEGSE